MLSLNNAVSDHTKSNHTRVTHRNQQQNQSSTRITTDTQPTDTNHTKYYQNHQKKSVANHQFNPTKRTRYTFRKNRTF
jgi:hypothetical protein